MSFINLICNSRTQPLKKDLEIYKSLVDGYQTQVEGLKEEIAKYNPPTPKILDEITGQELQTVIMEATYPDTPYLLYLLDVKYKITSKVELQKGLEFVAKGWNYIPEFRDCDDAAFRVNGLFSIGEWASIAYGLGTSFGAAPHAFNCAVTKEIDGMRFWIVEPQSIGGSIRTYEQASEMYKPLYLIMM